MAQNKGFVLALNYEIWLLKFNSSGHIEVYSFCSKLTICYINLRQCSLLSNNRDSLTYKTRMDLK